MCLITTAPKGTLKTREILKSFIESGMRTNTDGSGFVAKKKGKIILNKGFRTSVSILDAIEKLDLGIDDELVIHHRIGTSGDKNDINMHPFVCSSKLETLRKTEGTFNLPVMAHNGIFGAFSEFNAPYSDTFYFVQHFMSSPNIIALLKTNQSKFEDYFRSVLSTNKLAFLFPDRDMIRVGNFTEDNGYFHSNTGYKDWRVKDVGGVKHTAFPKDNRSRNFQNLNDGFDEALDLEEYYEQRYGSAHDSCCSVPRQRSKVLDADPIEVAKEMKESNIVNMFANLKFDGVSQKSLKFKGFDIEITKDNFDHFIFIPRYYSATGVEKDTAYVIDKFEPSPCVKNPISKYENNSAVQYVSVRDFILLCDVYVKGDHKLKYQGLSKLIELVDKTRNKAMLYVLTKMVDRNKKSKLIRTKKFGTMFFNDLVFTHTRLKMDLDYKASQHVSRKMSEESSSVVGNAIIDTAADMYNYDPMEQFGEGFGG